MIKQLYEEKVEYAARTKAIVVTGPHKRLSFRDGVIKLKTAVTPCKARVI